VSVLHSVEHLDLVFDGVDGGFSLLEALTAIAILMSQRHLCLMFAGVPERARFPLADGAAFRKKCDHS